MKTQVIHTLMPSSYSARLGIVAHVSAFFCATGIPHAAQDVPAARHAPRGSEAKAQADAIILEVPVVNDDLGRSLWFLYYWQMGLTPQLPNSGPLEKALEEKRDPVQKKNGFAPMTNMKRIFGPIHILAHQQHTKSATCAIHSISKCPSFPHEPPKLPKFATDFNSGLSDHIPRNSFLMPSTKLNPSEAIQLSTSRPFQTWVPSREPLLPGLH